ncbi:MAG: hypothetical protein AMJ81_09675 [Phycisphaerae bacterium SM23_33]|nr:MAG: hypothetical protein AMJ81_09675 [Phycisphaerae bacterium SM23_33]
MEMAVVVIIVAVLAGMIVPHFASWTGSSQLRESARGLLAAAAYAREFAATRRCCCRLVIAPGDQPCRLEYQKDPEHRPGEFEAMRDGVAVLPALSAPVRFGLVRIRPAEDGQQPQNHITFRPSGRSDAAIIQITDGRRTYSLVVLPSTGRASLVDGAVGELPDDRQDLDA